MAAEYDPYDFGQFLEKIAGLSHAQMLHAGETECAIAEGAGTGPGGPRQREVGCMEYAHRIRSLLWYLKTGTRPDSAGDGDFASYRPLVLALIARGDFRPEALRSFENQR